MENNKTSRIINRLADSGINVNQKDGYIEVSQPNGPLLGLSASSKVDIIVVDGKAFKSYDGSCELKPYEDWRLTAKERAADLAGRLSLDEIAGLMLYSRQNKLPMPDDTYGGKPFSQSGKKSWELSDGQRSFLLDDNVRHLLVSTVESPEAAARWNNQVQALVEDCGHGIPANNSSDPRHSAFADAEFAPGSNGDLSLWSNLMGLASTFNPEEVREFADIASAEYRAMGIATALSPQADLGTDPRWYRYNATFGNDPALVRDLVKAYCDGMQSSSDENGGWGDGSVNTMVKHWPGGGTGEGGRDAHYGNGKYAVYPAGEFNTHLQPFINGAFSLAGLTHKASAVMPYYTISYDQTSENVGNSFNRELITDLLRGRYGYDGVVCTDWIITGDQIDPGTHSGKPWGVEALSVSQRHYKALMAGVDQFGGNNEKGPVLEAFMMMADEHGVEYMQSRVRESAARLLENIFRPGLFENPYADVDKALRVVGNEDFMKKGYSQQLRSIVMLKNVANTLPLKPSMKIYIPPRKSPRMIDYWGNEVEESLTVVKFKDEDSCWATTDNPADADVAVVFIESPRSVGMGYDRGDDVSDTDRYIPISLQYRPYTAVTARENSIAGDPSESDVNRSYRGKTVTVWNESDLDLVLQVRREMGDKPVILVLSMSNPTVMAEIEPLADAILVGFSVQTQAFIDVICGKVEPSGLLPFEMPLSMEAIEAHCEDKPHDIPPYVDAVGNSYDFAFGLNFSGIIDDWRTNRYKLK